MINNRSVLGYLEETANKLPYKEAIVTEESSITFSEFRIMAQELGYSISKSTNEKNKPILVSVDRSKKTLIGFMGALYSGNYYVPVDIDTPIERINYYIENLNPIAFIHFQMDDKIEQIEVQNNLQLIAYDTFMFEMNISKQKLLELEEIQKKILDVNPCYVLYTSGSTGNPKGVVISHRMVRDLTDWLQSVTEIDENDVIGNQTPFFFDASVKDIYQMLKTGASLVILKPQLFVFTKKLIDFMNEKKVTVILWASAAISLVANSGILEKDKPNNLRLITFAGEQLFTKILNIWIGNIPNAMYINLYGPTETTVDCLYYIVDRRYKDDEVIPLGIACENKEVFLLDENNKEIKEGIGEITVRGTGVGLGYYNDPEKTNAVYIQNPSHNLYRDIVYKTGDLAYYNEEGLLVFASRKDDQIKLNGHRIELGEVEVAIHQLSNINDVACIYDDKKQVIIAYYTGEERKKKVFNIELLEIIPKYMIPAKYIYLEKMPLTQNGKIDKKLLKSSLHI